MTRGSGIQIGDSQHYEKQGNWINRFPLLYPGKAGMHIIFPGTMILTIIWLGHPTEGQLVDIPRSQPNGQQINSTFLFGHKGELYPILNYVHIRMTVSLANLSAGVHAICNTAKNFKTYIKFHEAKRTLFANGTENTALRRYKGSSLPSAVRVALDQGAVPSASFVQRAENIHHLIVETCDQGMATISLAVNLFTRGGNSSSLNRRRTKRNAMLGGMSLLRGGTTSGKPESYPPASTKMNRHSNM